MKNLVQNCLVAVALLLCLLIGFFVNIMLAGASLVVFMYLIYKMTRKIYLVYAFIVIPTLVFNGYSYYYLMVKEPEQITYYHKVLGIENDMISYEVTDGDDHNRVTTVERIKDETLADECRANNCNYISVNEITSNNPEWLNHYVKFSLIDIIHSYNNSRTVTVSRITDNTSAYDSIK